MNQDKESLKLPAVSTEWKDDDMNVVLVQPTVIQCVFKYLPPIDVHRCRFVCRAWYIEALRCLGKCPAVETYMVVQANVSHVLKFLMATGKLGFLTRLVLTRGFNDPCWGFFLNRDECKISPRIGCRFFLEDCLPEISQDKSRCVPGFSLIICSYQFDRSELLLLSSRSPVVCLISGFFCGISKDSESRIYKALGELVRTPNLYQSMIHAGMGTGFKNCSKYVDESHGFHLNRYISHHKVIITDYKRPPEETPFPIPDDPNYPARAIILLSVHGKANFELAEMFKECSDEFSFDVTDVSVTHNIWYHDVDFEGFRESDFISITFAGRDVASAVWEMGYEKEPSISEVSANIREFKESIKFPVDQRVIGFFCFSVDWEPETVYSEILSLVDEQFPYIKRFFLPFAICHKPHLRLHLVRV